MQLKDDEHKYQLIPMSDGDQHWMAITKDGVQVGNPELDANSVVAFIRELKKYLGTMTKI